MQDPKQDPYLNNLKIGSESKKIVSYPQNRMSESIFASSFSTIEIVKIWLTLPKFSFSNAITYSTETLILLTRKDYRVISCYCSPYCGPMPDVTRLWSTNY
jgi:hypothetical protein